MDRWMIRDPFSTLAPSGLAPMRAPNGLLWTMPRNTLNNPVAARQAPTQTRLLTAPEHQGYRGAAVNDELMAEAIRAYMTDPNYLKTVAPDVAARIREHVNSHPHLSRVVQFNSMLPPAIAFGMLMPQFEERY